MININKANNAEGFSAFAEIKTPDMFESNRPAVETSSNPSSAFNVFADMKKPDVFETRPKPEEESNSAFTAFSDMMDLDLFKSTKNKPDSLMALVAKEVGVEWYKSQLRDLLFKRNG